MTNQEKTNPRRMEIDMGVAPPPRFLLIIVIGVALLLIVLGIVAIFILRGGVGLTSLILPIGGLAALVFVVSIVGSLIFSKSLPRLFVLWVLGGWLAIALIGSIAGLLVYRNTLAPGQRETAKFYLPFLSAFDPPPEPAGLTLPTPLPGAGGPSALDLLNSPVGISTEEATEPVVLSTNVVEPPTATPTIEASATAVALAPTNVPVTDIPVVPTLPPETISNPSPSLPESVRLYSFRHIKQTWNNCGPANITMALSYYGWQDGQETAATFLKPDREDKNVNPSEMVAFVNENSGVRAITRIGGNLDLLRELLANEFPVIIETGYMPEGYDWLGHYQTVVGYDDLSQVFFLYDSYLGSGENGEGIAETYDDLDANWLAFNRTFIVIYRQEDEGRVAAILGQRADLNGAAEFALQTAQEEARLNPQNPFPWFNMGTAFTRLGRYEEAATAYDQARRVDTLPWRMLWYQFGMYEAYFNVGRYDDVLALVNSNLNNGGEYVEETYYWQGRVLAEQGQDSQAASAFRQALNRNPSFDAAQSALNEL
jgi:tetratricopeptide (TPR) repeat protein